jgi:hypothetical protein
MLRDRTLTDYPVEGEILLKNSSKFKIKKIENHEQKMNVYSELGAPLDEIQYLPMKIIELELIND